MQALVGLLALRAHGCLWLFMLALVTVDARVAAAAGAPRGLLSGRSLRPGAVEPQQFLEGKRKPQAQVVEAAARPSCKDDSEFEDELDSLSWELFTSPIGAGIPSPVRAPVPQAGAQEPGRAKLSAHAAPARRGRTAASLDLAGAAQERREKYSAAAAARLARWMQAVDRTQNFSKGDQRPAVLPPACPAVVPASDPYWTQKDSYAVKSGDQWIQYNECRYSENCTKQYTNLDRVNSIRKTLSITHKFLDKFNVQHGLYGGSAIGALRCQDVLPWDVDSDVFVLQQDFLKLSIMLDGMRNDTGWQGVGRSINMVGFGAEFDGFILMEKFPGCQPLVIVDKSTGFFTDLFPLKQHGSNVLVPWWAGEVVCDTQTLFHGCPTGKCHQWTLNNTLPPSRCQFGHDFVACPAKLYPWLVELFGAAVDTPDIEARYGNEGASLLDVQGRKPGGAEAPDRAPAFFIWMTVVFLAVSSLPWLCGAPQLWVVFSFYVGLYMAWAMITYATRAGQQSSAMMVLNALLVKLFVSLILWRALEGKSFLELPKVVWAAGGTLKQYAIPAGLYAVGDVLRLDALRATDPSTFAVLFNSRILFLALVWQWFMGRTLQGVHWASLLAIVVGCVLKELPEVPAGSTSSVEYYRRYWAYGEIVLLGTMTAAAAVYNEFLLQKQTHIGVSLQNLAMYTWGILWVFILAIGSAWYFGSATSPFHLSAWVEVWSEPLVALGVLVLACYGVTTAYFLRYLTNIAREVAIGVFALLSVAMDYLLFGESLVALEYMGVALVVTGVVLFAYNPVLALEEATTQVKKLPPTTTCSC